MKLLAIVCAVVCVSASAMDYKERVVTGEVAKNLFEAIYVSGVDINGHEQGFNMLEPAEIVCSVSREYEFTGGVFSNAPTCYKKVKESQMMKFDTKLSNTTALLSALDEAGADADGAAGTFYVSAKDIYCSYAKQNKYYKCTMKVLY